MTRPATELLFYNIRLRSNNQIVLHLTKPLSKSLLDLTTSLRPVADRGRRTPGCRLIGIATDFRAE